MQHHEQQKAKKPYCAPRLQVFGGLREITKNANQQGQMDAGIRRT